MVDITKDLLERIEPYDKSASSKIEFDKALTPELLSDLQRQLLLEENKEWCDKARNGKVFYIVNDDRWKRNGRFTPQITISFVGREKAPTISISYINH